MKYKTQDEYIKTIKDFTDEVIEWLEQNNYECIDTLELIAHLQTYTNKLNGNE